MSELPTRVVQLKVTGVRTGELADGLRKADPPVIARVMNDQLVLDPRTIQPGEINDLVSAFRQVLE
jgi:L-seryl-tRNA(Ser) seleniumtransferase